MKCELFLFFKRLIRGNLNVYSVEMVLLIQVYVMAFTVQPSMFFEPPSSTLPAYLHQIVN